MPKSTVRTRSSASAKDGIAYHEELASGWAAAYRRGAFPARLSLLRQVLARNVKKGECWADLGCGSGVLTKELVDLGAGRVIAIDGSPGMLAYAQRSVQSVPGVELEWVRGRVESLPSIDTGAIDGVLCSSVIEYVETPEASLLEIARILKPGGRLVVSVPPKGSVVRSLQKIARGMYRLSGRDAFTYLSVSRFEVKRASLPSLFERQGLSVSQVTAFDPILPRFICTVLQPALLIVEGRKLPA